MTTTEIDEGHIIENAEKAARQEIVDAVAGMEKITRAMRAFEGVEKVLRAMQSQVQLATEMDAMIARRRAEITAMDEHTTAVAVQKGQQRVDHIIAEAQRKAANIVGEAATKAGEVDKATDEKRAELASLDEKIESAKTYLRRLAQ
jgi:hypothetical protein